MDIRYTTTDARFGETKEWTIKEMMLRYRVNGYDIHGDGTHMTTHEMLFDIYKNGAKCIVVAYLIK